MAEWSRVCRVRLCWDLKGDRHGRDSHGRGLRERMLRNQRVGGVSSLVRARRQDRRREARSQALNAEETDVTSNKEGDRFARTSLMLFGKDCDLVQLLIEGGSE